MGETTDRHKRESSLASTYSASTPLGAAPSPLPHLIILLLTNPSPHLHPPSPFPDIPLDSSRTIPPSRSPPPSPHTLSVSAPPPLSLRILPPCLPSLSSR